MLHQTLRKILVLAFVFAFLSPFPNLASAGEIAPGHVLGSTYFVNSTLEEADNNLADLVCKTASNVCTLKAAIEQSNYDDDLDTIKFNIPVAHNAPLYITITQPLPNIIRPLELIGGNQYPGYPNRIVLDATDVKTAYPESSGLVILADNTTVTGLTIQGFPKYGINLANVENFAIGGMTSETQRVVIIGNGLTTVDSAGIFISGSNHGTIVNCNIGVDYDGNTAAGNSRGIVFSRSNYNTVGTATPGFRNVISGNTIRGIDMTGFSDATHDYVIGNQVIGNIIGLNRAGNAAVANNVGFYVNVDRNNVIGGVIANRNIIAGNTVGLDVNGVQATANLVIAGNWFDFSLDGVNHLPNEVSLIIRDSKNVTVGGMDAGLVNYFGSMVQVYRQLAAAENINFSRNYFGYRPASAAPFVTTKGLIIAGVSSSQFSRLIMRGVEKPIQVDHYLYDPGVYSSSAFFTMLDVEDAQAPAIDLAPLGPNSNDTLDADSGANAKQNHPVVNEVEEITTSIGYIRGTLHSKASTQYRIELYLSPVCRTEAYDGKYLGYGNTTTNASGNASFEIMYIEELTGHCISATATDLATMDTSEFSPGFSLLGAVYLPVVRK